MPRAKSYPPDWKYETEINVRVALLFAAAEVERMTHWEAPPNIALDEAIATFTKTLPGWWFSVGICHVTADATCAPDSAGCDAHLLKLESRIFDEGFDAMLYPPATMADALMLVMREAIEAKQKASRGEIS